MSNATTYMAVGASWIGSAGAAIAGFIKHAKKVEAQVANYATEAQTSVNNLLTQLEKINAAVEALSAPKPVANRAPSRKVTEAPVPKRRAGK